MLQIRAEYIKTGGIVVGKNWTIIDKPFQDKLAHEVRLSRRFFFMP